MRRPLLLAAALLVSAAASSAQQEGLPTSRSDHSRILFENDKVRVTEFDGTPGTQTGMRESVDHFLYPLKGCEYKATTAEGKTIPVTLQQGKVRWQHADEESDKVVGDRSCHWVRVDLKEPKPTSGSRGGR